ncbi:hypothetical protein EIP86_007411 [Pleurotus ostreatoroseus]|nr:hypothetical protein EIP86_007411 [Pleurotus ostreatoroseus]
MSFLARRKHRRRDDAGPNDNPLYPAGAADMSLGLGALPEDDAASMQAPSLLPTPSIRSTATSHFGIRKRLSNLSLLAGSLKRGRSSQQHPGAQISPQNQTQSPAQSLKSRKGKKQDVGAGGTLGAGAGVGFVMPASMHSRSPEHSRSPSPEPSLEIRRPSGLGRRASVIDLLDRPDDWEGRADGGVYGHGAGERKRSISTPELVMLPNGLLHWTHLPEKQHARGSSKSNSRSTLASKLRREAIETKSLPPIPRSEASLTQMPVELLKVILSHAERNAVAAVTTVCKVLTEPARAVLYANVNLTETVSEHQREQCVCLLASRRDLGAFVQSFACDSVPSASQQLLAKTKSKYSLITFAIALNNMPSLTSLTLPHFDASLLSYTSFRLRKLTFLCERVTNDDLQNTFEWLVGQPDISSLSFPNLILDDSNARLLAYTSEQHPSIPEDSVDDKTSWTVPSQVLKNLAEICGPASLVAALTPGRPVTSVRLHIHSTIYDGLRPSALVLALAQSSATSSITRLTLVAVSHADGKVDARTTERVLMSVGSELGESVQILAVESSLEDEVRTCNAIETSSNYREQVLRKLVGPVLSRYKTLTTLRLRGKTFPPPPTPPQTDSPLETTSSVDNHFLSTSFSLSILPSPSYGPSLTSMLPFPTDSTSPSASPLPSPTSATLAPFPSIASSDTSVLPPTTPLPSPANDGPCGARTQDRERAILASWTRHCASLRTVVFPSGTRWRIIPSARDPAEENISPAFTFVFEGPENPCI